MATFAKQTFNAATYASFRPSYPRQLFDYIFKFHEFGSPVNSPPSEAPVGLPKPRWNLAVDLGCGTGQATTELTPFKRVIGVDPSPGMIENARSHLASLRLDNSGQYEFVQSSAEDLNILSNESVDLLIAAQACHWFNWDKAWPEFARVLAPGGSAAFWVYSEFRLSQHPSLTPLITEYAQGADPANSLGPYWQQPGRGILEGHLLDVPEPQAVLGDGTLSKLHRVYFTGDHYPELPSAQLPIILRKRMTWLNVHEYLRTWSSLHTFQEKFPDDVKHDDGDIATRFWKALMKGAGAGSDTEQVDIEWPLALILAKKL